MSDFLFELGCEELPTSALKRAGEDLLKLIEGELNSLSLGFDEVQGIASPRRLGVLVKGLATEQADQTIVLRGPSKAVGFDENGEPSKALLGFCKKNGIEPSALNEVETPKGIWLEYQGVKSGQTTESLIPGVLSRSIQKLPLPKKMRWGATRQEFTRPVLWLVAMLDSKVIDCTLFDRQSGNQTRGHRVHSPGFIQINHAANYFDLLRDNRVIASFAERRAKVADLAASLSVQGTYQVVADNSLVDEVTALVEWPVPLMGSFSSDFLDVPSEALISSMKEHQKYFHVVDSDGQLVNRFVTMANLESKAPDLVIQGNQRVLNARLSDAKFFWDTDLKTPLAQRADKLDKIVFHEALGTLGEKCRRAGQLARTIAPLFHVKPEDAAEASVLAKCDLLSEMVLEFADLQGLMGTYYARREGMDPAIADALQEVYKPAGANDEVPTTPVGSTLALADKLDTLVGLFAVGQPPTGSKDPFALRRATLGLIRILLESQVRVNLSDLVQQAFDGLGEHATVAGAAQQVDQFILDRLKVLLAGLGIDAQVFSAITGTTNTLCPVTIAERCNALKSSLGSEDLLAVASGSKRIANILAKATESDCPVNPTLFEISAETQLWEAFQEAERSVSESLANGAFEQALSKLAALRHPIDAYFESVMVNADQTDVRTNRIATLRQLDGLFGKVADLSQVSA